MSIDARLHRRLRPAASGFRRDALRLAARMAAATGALRIALRARPGKFILAYHRVLSADAARDEWCHPSLWISPELFDAQLAMFAGLGRIVPLDELLTAPDGGQNLFSVTFDDAWADNLANALPILDKHGARCCLFVPTDAVTNGQLFWSERAAILIGRAIRREGPEVFLDQVLVPGCVKGRPDDPALLSLVMGYIEALKELSHDERSSQLDLMYRLIGVRDEQTSGRIMSWEQIRALADAGHTIGSHSKSHTILKGIPDKQVNRELSESKEEIQERVGRKVRYFCYPNARFDSVSSDGVLMNGYSHGFRMHNLRATSASDPSLVPRFSISGASASLHWLKLRLAVAGNG